MTAEKAGQHVQCPACSWIGELPVALLALKLGALAGLVAYVALGNASDVDDFIAGQMALYGDTAKSRDYAAAIAFLLSSAAAFVLGYEGLRCAARRLPGPVISGFRTGLLLANIPAALALGQLFFSVRVDPELIAVSLFAEVGLALCLGVAWWAARRSADTSPQASARAFSWVLSVLLFAYMAGATVPSAWAAALSTLGLYELGPSDVASIALFSKTVIGVVVAVACALTFTIPEGDRRERRLKLLFLLAQGVLLLALVKLLGSLGIVAGRAEYVATATPAAVVLVLLLGLGTLVHLRLMARALRRDGALGNCWFIATPVAVALLNTLLKTAPDLPASFNMLDDYHTGEYVLPYWALKTWGMLPYSDLDPARGWINLFAGLIAEEGLGGSYASYAFTSAQGVFLISLLLFAASRPLVGVWGALLLVILAPIGLLSEIDLLLTGGFALLVWAYFSWRPSMWLLLWVLVGTLSVLAAPGQGGLSVLAMLPLGVAQAVAAARTEPGRFALAGSVVAMATAVVLLTPVGNGVVGAVRYAIEQSAVNSLAHGIPWAVSLAQWTQGQGALFEVARSSWLLVTVGIAFVAWVALRSDRPVAQKRRILVVAAPIVVLGLLFVLRAWGRIDPGEWSRPAITSAWFIALMLPLFVFAVRGNQISGLAVLALVLAAAILPPPRWSFRDANALQTVSASELIDGAEYGVPALGRFAYAAEQVENYAALKRFADSELPPGAPFLDLTSRNTLYYLLDRPPGLPAAVYNLANPGQQARVVRTLAADPPMLALADSHSIRHDGGVLGLRANSLFRFVIEHYRPVEDSGAVWMRYDPSGARGRDKAELRLLDRAFMQRDLRALPSAWGRAWDALADKTRGELRLDLDAALLNDVVRGDAGNFVVTGPDPYVTMAVPPGVDGARWGLLVFDFDCGEDRAAPLEVFWANEAVPSLTPTARFSFVAKPGRVVVPLDSAPRWVLGGLASLVRIDLADPNACPTWAVSELHLTSRANFPGSMP